MRGNYRETDSKTTHGLTGVNALGSRAPCHSWVQAKGSMFTLEQLEKFIELGDGRVNPDSLEY